jgi:hypothetical protein
VAPRKQAPLRIATQAKKSSGHPIFGSSGAGHSARKPLRLRPVERTATGTPINMRKKRCVPSACAAAARFPPPASALDRLALSAAQRAHPHLRTQTSAHKHSVSFPSQRAGACGRPLHAHDPRGCSA